MDLRIMKLYIRGEETFMYELNQMSTQDHSEDDESYGVVYTDTKGVDQLILASKDGPFIVGVKQRMNRWREELKSTLVESFNGSKPLNQTGDQKDQ